MNCPDRNSRLKAIDTCALSQLVPAVKILLLLCAPAVMLFAHAEGAGAGYSGAPNEQNCAACHSSGTGFGSVDVAFPNGLFYAPGVKQHLVVTITDTPQKSWGFQLTTRDPSNNQAGSYTPGADGFTQVLCADTAIKNTGACGSKYPLQYIEQTLAGNRAGYPRSITFEFDWTPPTTNVGAITVYIASVAADGSQSGTNDHVYNKNYVLNVPVAGQPIISPAGVVNGAGFQTTIAPGSWVTVTGTNLSTSSRLWAPADFAAANGKLPTSLDGVTATIGGVPAYVEYISPTQVNLVAPSNPPFGSVAVVVSNNGAVSNTINVSMQTSAPALFLWNGKYAVATRPDYSLVGPSGLFGSGTTVVPAKSGDVIILWANGLGPTTPVVPSGSLTPTDRLFSVLNPPTVSIGSIGAVVTGAALAPGFAGLYQIAVQVPNGLGNGDQPIRIQSGSAQSPTGVFLNVQN